MDCSGHGPQSPEAVCVTGATGYIGSWLVRSLLEKGYLVHATARDTEKASRILSEFGSSDGLKIFRADLHEEGSFDAAVQGCVGVFHVAASMEFTASPSRNIGDHLAPVIAFPVEEEYVKTRILEPASKGTVDLLRSCCRAGTVRRVVFTSSISTITAKDDAGKWKRVVDESCVTPSNIVWSTKPNGWVYVLSKLYTEEKAFQFAKENGIDLVSIISPTVAGPFLTPNVPASIQVLFSPITGDPELYPILQAVHERLGSVALVHIEDICNAHIFLMKKSEAHGRYMCSAGSSTLPQIAEILSSEYPCFITPTKELIGYDNESVVPPPTISSKRITDLGFKFTYTFKEVIKQTVASCLRCGFLNPN